MKPFLDRCFFFVLLEQPSDNIFTVIGLAITTFFKVYFTINRYVQMV